MSLTLEKCAWKDMGSHILVMDLRQGAIYSLESSAAALWHEIVKSKEIDPSRLVKALMEQYEVDERRAEQDVDDFLAQLRAKGTVVANKSHLKGR